MSCEEERAAYEAAKARLEAHPGCPPLDTENNQSVICHGALENLRRNVRRARRALEECENGVRILEAEGLLTFLRVHEKETGYGGGRSNQITADVIFKLDSKPDKAFGFELRDDDNLPVRQGMLGLLRDALLHDLRVSTDYYELVTPPNQNSFVLRIALAKSRPPIDVRRDEWLVE